MKPPHRSKTVEQTIQGLLQRKLHLMAHERLGEALEENPTSRPLRHMYAETLSELGDYIAARSVLEQLHTESPDDLKAAAGLPVLLQKCGDQEAALETAIGLVDRVPPHRKPRTQVLVAEMYMRSLDFEAARALLSRIPEDELGVRLVKQYTEAEILLQEKRFDEGVALLRGYIDQRDDFASEHMQIPEKTTAWFLLAKTYDRAKAYDEAWAAAEAAHEPYRGWDCNRAVEELQNLQSFFSRDLVQALTRSDKTFEWKPLYIVGMPRSGTTLLEQILSMHGSVSNGGEMSVSLRMLQTLPKITDSYHQFPNCVLDMQTSDANALGDMYMDACRPFAAGTAMASNKALNLQAHLGFLSRVVPDARAIMLYRHPLDNAVSCHTNNLVTLGHRFTTDLRHFGKIWVARRKLQEHWLEVLDMPMLELHYEQMVRNQDEETRRLIDFLELDWDAKCLDFHESTNVARTISWDQVNKKMYNTSDGRWKHYEKHLGPAIEELGEYL